MEEHKNGLVSLTKKDFKKLCEKHTSKELSEILNLSAQTIVKEATVQGIEIKKNVRAKKKK